MSECMGQGCLPACHLLQGEGLVCVSWILAQMTQTLPAQASLSQMIKKWKAKLKTGVKMEMLLM